MRSVRSIIVSMAAGFSLLLTSMPIFAGNAPAAKVIKEVELGPQEGNEVVLKSVMATEWDNGRVTVTVKDSAPVGANLAYSIDVDLAKGTYKTKLEAPWSDAPASSPPSAPTGVTDTQASTAITQSATLYSLTVYVRTDDPYPFDMELARTRHRLIWAADGTSVSGAWNEHECIPKNPTSIGTHWYTDVCENLGAFWDSAHAATSGDGQYYNYDFGDPDEATYTLHDMTITGFPTGRSDYTWGWNAWGEYSGFLHAHVWITS